MKGTRYAFHLAEMELTIEEVFLFTYFSQRELFVSLVSLRRGRRWTHPDRELEKPCPQDLEANLSKF